MAYNGGRVIEPTGKIAPVPSKGMSGVAVEEEESEIFIGLDLPSQALIEKELQTQLRMIREKIDSPKALLIIRNAALTLLELNKAGLFEQKSAQKLDLTLVKALLSDPQFRQTTVERLIATTPNFWDHNWEQAWTKDAEPLYSERQQRIVRRRSLISFWTKEWQALPRDQLEHAVQVVGSVAPQ